MRSLLRPVISTLLALIISGHFCDFSIAGGKRVDVQKSGFVLVQVKTLDQRIEAAEARAIAAEERANAAEKRAAAAGAVNKNSSSAARERARASEDAITERDENIEMERTLDRSITQELIRGKN